MSTRSKRSAAAVVSVETPSKVAKLSNGAAPPAKKAKSEQIRSGKCCMHAQGVWLCWGLSIQVFTLMLMAPRPNPAPSPKVTGASPLKSQGRVGVTGSNVELKLYVGGGVS